MNRPERIKQWPKERFAVRIMVLRHPCVNLLRKYPGHKWTQRFPLSLARHETLWILNVSDFLIILKWGTIKFRSKFPVSGVKGNLSYKITNTFITHLTEKAVNSIHLSVKRFVKRQEFCIFSPSWAELQTPVFIVTT